MSDIRVEGLDKLMKKLRQVRSDSNSVVERGLLRAGNKVRNTAVLLCPVDTGELRNSIRVEKIAPQTVAVGTNLEYAPYVEYGTGTQGDPSVPHTSKESWSYQDENGAWHTSHGHPAQPFLRPAVDEQEIGQTVADEVRRSISDA